MKIQQVQQEIRQVWDRRKWLLYQPVLVRFINMWSDHSKDMKINTMLQNSDYSGLDCTPPAFRYTWYSRSFQFGGKLKQYEIAVRQNN
ncbi:hypothetical protein CS542_05025 [Pedobacter sp. IW39]|nr:hypothetical protein CS542_05025 [Pedobacter sp. IW39]